MPSERKYLPASASSLQAASVKLLKNRYPTFLSPRSNTLLTRTGFSYISTAVMPYSFPCRSERVHDLAWKKLSFSNVE